MEIDDPASDVVGAALHPRGRLLIAILDDQFRDPIAIFLDLHANILRDSARSYIASLLFIFAIFATPARR